MAIMTQLHAQSMARKPHRRASFRVCTARRLGSRRHHTVSVPPSSSCSYVKPAAAFLTVAWVSGNQLRRR
uniref:Uncharacterized protein n=1 Tax=Arundo donax TaxID=35708 RepID=A0A0A8XPM7_ARUDO